jgi:hypothetical protein
MSEHPFDVRCECGHRRGMHFRLGDAGGCMRPTEKSPSCDCRGFRAEAQRQATASQEPAATAGDSDGAVGGEGEVRG